MFWDVGSPNCFKKDYVAESQTFVYTVQLFGKKEFNQYLIWVYSLVIHVNKHTSVHQPGREVPMYILNFNNFSKVLISMRVRHRNIHIFIEIHVHTHRYVKNQ